MHYSFYLLLKLRHIHSILYLLISVWAAIRFITFYCLRFCIYLLTNLLCVDEILLLLKHTTVHCLYKIKMYIQSPYYGAIKNKWKKIISRLTHPKYNHTRHTQPIYNQWVSEWVSKRYKMIRKKIKCLLCRGSRGARKYQQIHIQNRDYVCFVCIFLFYFHFSKFTINLLKNNTRISQNTYNSINLI